MEALSSSLNSLEIKLQSDIQNDCKKHGLHNQSRVETLSEKVKRERESFIQGIDDIQRQDFVSELKRLTDNVLDGGRTTLNDIKQEIDNNERYMTDIQFDRQVLKESMGRALQNVVVLSFTIPESIRLALQQQQQKQFYLQQQNSAKFSRTQNFQSPNQTIILNQKPFLNNVSNRRPSECIDYQKSFSSSDGFMTPIGNRRQIPDSKENVS
jgi:hypothetical protein